MAKDDRANSSAGFFGVPLDSEAPIVVCDCIAFLRNRGLYDEGVFRLNGNQATVKKLKDMFNKEYPDREAKTNKNVSVLNVMKPTPSVFDVGSLLKAFFSDLPEPIIPRQTTEEMIAILNERSKEKKKMKRLFKAMKKIESPNRECLGFFISFVRELCGFRKFNQMNADNLARMLVFPLMGGGFEPLEHPYLVQNGASIIGKLIMQNIDLYLPRVSEVTANTKYTAIDDLHNTEQQKKNAAKRRKGSCCLPCF